MTTKDHETARERDQREREEQAQREQREERAQRERQRETGRVPAPETPHTKTVQYSVVTKTFYEVTRIVTQDGVEKREGIGLFPESPMAEAWKTWIAQHEAQPKG